MLNTSYHNTRSHDQLYRGLRWGPTNQRVRGQKVNLILYICPAHVCISVTWRWYIRIKVIWQSNVDLKNIPYLIAPVSMTVYSWNFKKDRKIVASCLKKKIPNSVVGKHAWLKTYTGCSSATTGTSKITKSSGVVIVTQCWGDHSFHFTKKSLLHINFFFIYAESLLKQLMMFASRRIVVVCLITFRVMLNHVMMKACKFRWVFFHFLFLFA